MIDRQLNAEQKPGPSDALETEREKASPVTLTMPAQTAVDLRRALHWRIQDIQHTIFKISTEWSPKVVPKTFRAELRRLQCVYKQLSAVTPEE